MNVSTMSAVSQQRPTRPDGRPLMRMQWRDLLFIHWRVDAALLRPLIPQSLEIDEFDGSAWIGLVPFTMREVLPHVVPGVRPLTDMRAVSAFHECNVRTYVYQRGRPELRGVWFFSLDAASRLAVWGARRFFHLPYFRAKIKMSRRENEIDYALDRADSPRAKMQCIWREGERLSPTIPDELAYFLTERYALYAVDCSGSLRRCCIWHDPWPLRTAELLSLDDGLVRAAGIEVDRDQSPVLHCASKVDVLGWPLEHCQLS